MILHLTLPQTISRLAFRWWHVRSVFIDLCYV